jgi:hypothetical protein
MPADAFTCGAHQVVAVTFVRLAWFPGAGEQHFRDLAAALSHVPAPDGRLAFAAGPVDGGWQVVQIWTDQAALDDFNASFFAPALASLGSAAFPQPPVVVDFETAIFESR